MQLTAVDHALPPPRQRTLCAGIGAVIDHDQSHANLSFLSSYHGSTTVGSEASTAFTSTSCTALRQITETAHLIDLRHGSPSQADASRATDLNRTRVIDIARTSLRAAESIAVAESVIIRI